MSIQNRLLFIYTSIFSIAFILFALIIYLLPQDRILAEIDADLEALAAEVVQPGPIPEDLINFATASTFVNVIDNSGRIIQSPNLFGFDSLLDPDGINSDNEKNFRLVRHDDTLIRVLTVPLIDNSGTEPQVMGHVQVARLLNDYENFNSILIIALLIGLAAATASLFLAVLLTPRLFRPLEKMVRVAQQITKADDLSRRFPDSEKNDEFGDLSRAFNQTLERLERLFIAQQRLLADVSHELRTPLTSVRGNIDLMRRMGEADPESMSVIQDEIERMTRLVGDLLLLARADSGGLPIKREPVELDNLLFEVYRQVNILHPTINLEITVVDQVCVLGDSDRLKQLVINLVDNAIKYTPDQGTVSLSLSKDTAWARLEIADTGIGIPPEDLPHIFDRFYRVDKARSRSMGGSGLGLAIAKWIAQAHGGGIKVISGIGQGTTFTITLPLHAEKEVEDTMAQTRPGLSLLGTGLSRNRS